MDHPLSNYEGVAGLPAADSGTTYDVEKAGFLRRGFALIIDLILLSIASRLIQSVGNIPGMPDWAPSLLSVISLTLPLVYFTYAFSSGGQTLGKVFLGVQVISIDGYPLNWRKGLWRTIGYICSWMVFLGFLWALWDEDKQAWQDKLAGTCVVRTPVDAWRLQGAIDPLELQRRLRRWRIGLGLLVLVPFLLLFAGMVGFVYSRLAEVRAMQPWPGPKVAPAEVARVDLSSLGLGKPVIKDARDGQTGWTNGNYEVGAYADYKSGNQPAVRIWALRYPTSAAARGDFQFAAAYDQANCGASTNAYLGSSGAIRCWGSEGYDTTLWNDRWILDIWAGRGGGANPAIVAAQVRDALAAGWRTLPGGTSQ